MGTGLGKLQREILGALAAAEAQPQDPIPFARVKAKAQPRVLYTGQTMWRVWDIAARVAEARGLPSIPAEVVKDRNTRRVAARAEMRAILADPTSDAEARDDARKWLAFLQMLGIDGFVESRLRGAGHAASVRMGIPRTIRTLRKRRLVNHLGGKGRAWIGLTEAGREAARKLSPPA
jgi:hypothetical protein